MGSPTAADAASILELVVHQQCGVARPHSPGNGVERGRRNLFQTSRFAEVAEK